MRANYNHIAPFIEQCKSLQGDFAEFGVWYGHTFVQMAISYPDHVCHAIDSFRGMDAPTEKDNNQYLKGALSVGGSKALRDATSHLPNVRIHEGYVPDILQHTGIERIAFAHVDLDQYQPTLQALLWCWKRMVPGGILVSHDYIQGRDYLAAGGANEFMRLTDAQPIEITSSAHICWRHN